MIISFASTLLVSILLTNALNTGCPSSCICKWRNGKQSVECIGKSLLIIPNGIDAATQVLDVSGNIFQYIQQQNFLKMGLINLQKLFLSRSGIKLIQDDAFKGLTNLVELDLSENILEKVPTEALLNCPSLMRLSLSKNPISSLDRLAFNHLSFLTTLDLSGCEITEVHEAAFSSLYSLQWIDMTQNKIRYFPDLGSFPNRLKGVQLHDNPWTCDCHIRQFSFWLKKNIVPILIPPVCREPRKLRGIPVKGLNETELACIPEVTPISFYFELEEGKNISLLCQVKSTPPAKISWIFKGQVLQNNTEPFPELQLMYFTEEGAEEKQSSLFIHNLNSENNGTFYCLAENSAGVTSANYTIMIILKHQAPIRLEEKPEFPIDIISIFLAAGLVIISLCFVALIMTLIKHHTKPKKRKEKNDNISTLPMVHNKSILKHIDNQRNLLVNDGKRTERAVPQNNQISEQNPDIINEINSDQNSPSAIQLYGHRISQKNESNLGPSKLLPSSTLIMPQQIKPPPIIGNPITLNRKTINRQRTQPYLKPTLTTNFRPISAPSFERYVENHDLRYTVDGYPARHGVPMANYSLRRPMVTQTSYSELSSPKMDRRPKELINKVIEVQTLTQKHNIAVFKDDVRL